MQSPELQRLTDMVSRPGFNLFYNAPLLIMIFADPVGFMPQIDCALAIEPFLKDEYSRKIREREFSGSAFR